MEDADLPIAGIEPAGGERGLAGGGQPDGDVDDTDAAFSSEVGSRLRAIRRAQGLSLADVEARSGGQWSASAVGAYERGFRNLSVPRLKALADFFGVPAGVLLGEPGTVDSGPHGGLVFDLERLREAMSESPLLRFTQAIVQARGDFNGRILSIRRDDLQAVCAMIDPDPVVALEKLASAGVLLSPGDRIDAAPGFA